MQWKRSILALIIGIVGINFGYGYEPHPEEIQQLTTLKAQLSELSDDHPQVLWALYQQLRDFAELVPSPASLNYQLQHLRNFLLDKIESRIQITKSKYQADHQNFLNEHSHLLTYAQPLSPNCYGWYTTLDMMSFAYDFPTALTIAVWRKESSCGFYLPKNGDGPFQIINKDYGA